MHETPSSLLLRLRQPGDEVAWQRFVQLYAPLLFHVAGKLGMRGDDAADLVQDVFAVLVRCLPDFSYDRGKSFRAFLKSILLNKWRDLRRRVAASPIESVGGNPPEAVVPDELVALAEDEYRDHLLKRALRIMQSDFEPATWQGCWAVVVEARPAADVARELGLTVNAVYLARSRVLYRLRQELAGLLD